MIGAIIGDIVGSVYEWANIKTKDFPLFRQDCFFTDDTVMTLAIAEGLMNGGSADDFVAAMKKYGRLYSDAGYGGRFSDWLGSDYSGPYDSWGNGSAMRVSAVGWAFDSLEQVEEYAEICAAVTHNHPEGTKGAKATAASIFLARKGKSKSEIKTYVECAYGYNLDRTLDEIRPVYQFNESCQETVPEAIIAFLESVDFEDAIRNAISLGGDSDTLAAITGSIAEAAYGVPEDVKEQAQSSLDDRLSEVYNKFCSFIVNGSAYCNNCIRVLLDKCDRKLRSNVGSINDEWCRKKISTVKLDDQTWIYRASEDNKNRYILGVYGKRPLICFGINPSTARPGYIDPTARSVSRIAKHNEYDSWIMLNIYPQRKTNPDEIDESVNTELLEANLYYIREVIELYKPTEVWAAWGNLIKKRDFLMDCFTEISKVVKEHQCNWITFGEVNKSGHPRHPLYLKTSAGKYRFEY